MRVLIGLGNPGPTYHNTRHNLGFRVIDILAERWHLPLEGRIVSTDRGRKAKRCGLEGSLLLSRIGRGCRNNQTVLLVQPQTFMNNSGEAAGRIREWYSLSAPDFVVVHDDLDLPLGRIRIKRGGSGAGGNRGVASIIDGLGSKAFPRVKIGIGRPQDATPVTDFVLRRFTEQERAFMLCAARRGADAVEAVVAQGLERAMDGFNRAGSGG